MNGAGLLKYSSRSLERWESRTSYHLLGILDYPCFPDQCNFNLSWVLHFIFNLFSYILRKKVGVLIGDGFAGNKYPYFTSGLYGICFFNPLEGSRNVLEVLQSFQILFERLAP